MTKTRDLPPRCYLKHGAFFYVSPDNKWHNLGRDRDKALLEYGRRVAPTSANVSTMPGLVDVAMPLICRGKADSTAKTYREIGTRLKAIFAEFRVEDVRPKHIAQLKASMVAKPNMANRFLTVLRLLFAYATEQQLCEWNPTVGIKPYPEAKRTRLLTDTEVDAIRAKATPRLRALIGVLRITGQRVGDVLRIRRADLTEQGLFVQQGKTGAKVLILWTPDLKAAVDEALSLQKNVKALTLFTSRTGKVPDYRTVLKQWHKAVAAAQVENANIHDLRAVAITSAHKQGLDPRALAGHTSQRMTDRYIRERMGVEVLPPSLSKKVSKNG